MKYYNIKNKLSSLKVFTLQDLYIVDPDFRQATLYDWESAGKVVKLRNNKYIFADYRPQDLEYYLIANKLYKPSYVSLELALNHYNVIPESVQTVTSITTNKTNNFKTKIGVFTYRSIEASLYFGYKVISNNNHGILLATIEKAILDYLYLNPSITTLNDFEQLRWNKIELKESIDKITFNRYLNAFSNKALDKRIEIFNKYIIS